VVGCRISTAKPGLVRNNVSVTLAAQPHKHAQVAGVGRRQAAKHAGGGHFLYGLSLTWGAVVAAVAWFFLVRSAIDFGRVALDGQNRAWLFAAAASVGGAVCLMLVFVLVLRALRALGVVHGRRSSAGHRAI
jgi:hypothetical protein